MGHIQHLFFESLVKMDHFQKEPPLNLKWDHLGKGIGNPAPLPCPYRKSNPYVLMVQPSKNGPHLDAPGALNEPSNWRILA